MNVIGFILLLFAHLVCGYGVVSLFSLRLSRLSVFCLSLIIGVPVVSFAPCILQLLAIPLTATTVSIGIATMTAICSAPLLKARNEYEIGNKWRPRLYEWPFYVLFITAIVISAWRCFYYPPTARDMLAGPEVLAEFAVREHTMVSSVFSVDLSTSNNYHKSPFITALQIIYKLVVQPFGQVWLSIIAVPFLVWLFAYIRSTIHPLPACVIFMLFLTIPEVYAYSFLMLYDYANMVFFFFGCFFLFRFLQDCKERVLAFSALLFGLATYIRTETIILVVMLSPMLLLHAYKKRLSWQRGIWQSALPTLACAVFYLVCIKVFVHRFVPVPFNAAAQLNQHLADVQPFFTRISDMATDLVFSSWAINVYGWYLFIFCALLLADLIAIRKLGTWPAYSLFAVAVVFTGLAFIGYLLPLADLTHTTKRGMFKLMPLIALYMAHSPLMQKASRWLHQWEAS